MDYATGDEGAEQLRFPVIAAATLAGSLASCFATSCVLLSFAIYRHQITSFRHVLVLNLSLAECINSLNNSISGIIFIRNGELHQGTACTINGLVGQLSVQAGDFSILAIAVVTLLTVTRTVYLPDASVLKKAAICLAVWVIPIATSTTATALGQMTTVGGNWCWISADRPDLRYGLTHGWRFAVIFSTIAIYVYIWVYLRAHFNEVRGAQRWSYQSTGSSSGSIDTPFRDESPPRPVKSERLSVKFDHRPDSGAGPLLGKETIPEDEIESLGQPSPLPPPAYMQTEAQAKRNTWDEEDASLDEMMYGKPKNVHLGPPKLELNQRDVTATMRTSVSEFPMRRTSARAEQEIKRMLLLNAYPIMYILLWIPGIVNRLLEASGNAPSPKIAASLQVSTQFVGLANALTYGFNHHLRDRLKDIYVSGMISRVTSRSRRR